MKLSSLALLASIVQANPLLLSAKEPEAPTLATEALKFSRRGAPDAPDGYTPVESNCPSTRPSIRAASSLSSQETNWRGTRIPNTLDAMRTLLGRLNITGLDTTTYLNNHQNNITAVPKIGIAASGGGYRALMNGAGALAAFDSRSSNSSGVGQLGGLLQSSLYLAGLSGGGWLVGSLYQNNFTSVENIVNGKEGSTWDFTNSIFEGPNHGIQVLTSLNYYKTLHDEVEGKEDAGFNTTVTDYWGRALSFQLIDANDGGPAYTWSSLASGDYVTAGTAPLPILICDGRRPGEQAIADNTTIFEFNPWEMGSWDPTVYGFAPMEYVGSNFTNGALPDNEECVRGYDSASFIMGTSSSLFNEFAIEYSDSNLPSIVNDFIKTLLQHFTESEEDIASWNNPFYGYHPNTNLGAGDRQLTLVDGGENGENIPLHPLIQPDREVDVIFAIDSSADTTYSWPNGTSLVASYERSKNGSLQNHTAFPSIPDQNTFVNLGLNRRPTFFGCDASNFTDANGTQTAAGPLIVYLPNSPYNTMSNLSTFDPSYPTSQRNAVIENGYNVATRGNSSDQMWPTCVGCAILRRSLEKTGTAIPEVCTQCYNSYCWNGTVNSTTPAPYEPVTLLSNASTTNAASGLRPELSLFAAGFVAVVAFLV